MHNRAVTWATEKDRRIDMRQRRIAEVKHRAYMFGHKIFWKTLYLIGLGRPYSVTMCKLNLYAKFPDGRCHWCGIVH